MKTLSAILVGGVFTLCLVSALFAGSMLLIVMSIDILTPQPYTIPHSTQPLNLDQAVLSGGLEINNGFHISH